MFKTQVGNIFDHLDQECCRERLMCIKCIEDSIQGVTKIISIETANEYWKNHQESLLDSVNNCLKKREQNILVGKNILQKQYAKFCLDNQEYQKMIFQSKKQIQIKQQKIIQEKNIKIQDLEGNDLLNRINFLVNSSENKNQISLINEELNKDNQRFITLFKQYLVFLDQIKQQCEYEIFQFEGKQMTDLNYYYWRCQNISNRYPNNIQFVLEEFNVFNLNSYEENSVIIQRWSDCMKNFNKNKQFTQILVDCIKRNNSFRKRIISILINYRSKNVWNNKQLFQLLYNNSSDDLQYMLLRNYGQCQPLPFIYQNSILGKVEGIKDFFLLNKSLFHIFPQCFPIINFSLSNNSSSYGKTKLINQIFYGSEVFEINDQSELNLHTIDIMFDFCFNGTRQFAIADAHGIIPFEILIKILPLFKFWIVQMNTEDELQENFEQFQKIKKQIKIPKCCFIVRNSKNLQSKSQLEGQIQSENIDVYKIIDITQKQLDKQTICDVMEQFSKFIFDKIRLEQSKYNLVDWQNYLELIQEFYGRNHFEIKNIIKENTILLNLRDELNKYLKDPLGFYSMNAFPMRSLMWQIKNNKQEQYEFDGLSKQQEISTAEKQIPFVQPTRLLELFQEIFQSQYYYILYLKFKDQIREFNLKNTKSLQEENQIINEDLQQKKQKKNQLKRKNQDGKEIYQIKVEIVQLKKKLQQNLKEIEIRNIDIDFFWREIISIKQNGQKQKLQINPAEIVAKMVKKGEPFQFLDGDQLQIDQNFLLEFIEQYPDHDKQKVLVLSILGPLSSGKSTILNKIFGCHFQASLMRGTKGIQIQLIKITQKSYFDDKFDYVLILDSEGLQNPNQNDPEFDKKIALFILAISDIILINVKGDIHSQFKNLMEMCIFTLGQMKSSISAFKQLSWCFNQNNDCMNYCPFLQQIESIVRNLNMQIQNEIENEQDSQSFDYNEVLDLRKENIKILGFALTEQSWRINPNTGIYEEWRQQILNETFSEEAYDFCVQMILQYLQKHNAEQINHLPSLQQFIQNIENTWSSICKLPDLSEFTELLQYKQDQFMKAIYDQIYQKYPFDYQMLIPSKIQAMVLSEKKKSLEFFKKIEKEEKIFIEYENRRIINQIEEELQRFKQEKQIQNKICKKYIRILGESLQKYEYSCHLTLFDEIKKHEREFQQKKGFPQIEDLVAKISQDSYELNKLKGQRQLIETKFNSIWSYITQQAVDQQEQIFYEFSYAEYQVIYSFFDKYQYKSTNQELYWNSFFNICKQPPQTNIKEKEYIFDLYFCEIKNQLQFSLISQTQNRKYNEIFHQSLYERCSKSSKNQVVDINEFYCCQTTIYYITVNEFKLYINGEAFFKDFIQILKDNEEQNNPQAQSYDKIIQIYQEFFSILYYCCINYSEEKYKKLKQYITIEGSQPKFGYETKSYFEEFQKSFKFSNNSSEIIKNQEFTRNVQKTYPSLTFKTSLQKNNQNQIENQFKQKSQEIWFVYLNMISLQNDTPQIFHYIADQKQNSNQLTHFNNSIQQEFFKIMEQTQGWRKIIYQVYDIIKQKMSYVRNDSKNEEILPSDNYLIKQIMSIIEQQIIEYNKQFANFGIILSQIGERCIYYYSIFIIWRFSCYSQWRQLEENSLELQQMKQEQLTKFAEEIKNNKFEQSILNAQALARNIKTVFFERFYSNQRDKVKNSFESRSQSNSELIKFLDLKLLNYEKAKQNNISEKEILDYIMDQRSYIEKYVEDIVKKKQEEIKREYEIKLRQELKEFLRIIFYNVSIIYSIIKCQDKALKSEQYFEIIDNDSTQIQDYENILFLLISKCIQGEQLTKDNLQKINYQQREIFENRYEKVEISIFVRLQNNSQNKIPLLKPFIEELHKQLESEIYASRNEPLILKNLQIQENLNKLKLNMIGCLFTCPMCRRKCDQPADSIHKHACTNGHQYRGMNGVLIDNQPSLFTCEEIDDNQLIITLETNYAQKWKDIKKVYSDWNFIGLSMDKMQELKGRMSRLWNSGIGELICKELSSKLHQNIQFDNQINISSHYVIMLQDSGSMHEQKYKNAALQCMNDIFQNDKARVSVIQFKSKARCVIDCQKVDIESQERLITSKNSQGFFNLLQTDFNNAFLLAYDQITKHFNKQFEKNIILFYTDGEGYIPSQAIEKFSKLSLSQRQTIQLISCVQEDVSLQIMEITDRFKKVQISTEQKFNNDRKKVWSEVVSKCYHQLKC